MPLFSMSSKKEKEELTKLSAEFNNVKNSDSLMKCLKSLQKIAQSRGFFSNLIKRSDRGMLGARKILDKVFGIKGDKNPNKVEIMNAGIQVKNVMFKTTRGATKIIGKSIKTALENLIYISLNFCACSLYAQTKDMAIKLKFKGQIQKQVGTFIDQLIVKRKDKTEENIQRMINSQELGETIGKYFENLIIKLKICNLWKKCMLISLKNLVRNESEVHNRDNNVKEMHTFELFLDDMFFHKTFFDDCKKENYWLP